MSREPFYNKKASSAERFLVNRINYESSAKIPYGQRDFKLDRMCHLMDQLGNVQNGLKVVHVAGTKGKGSTASMIASILTSAGYRTGLYSSPHLTRIEERLSLNGKACLPDDFARLVEQIRPTVEHIDKNDRLLKNADPRSPTYFDVTTALAFLYFAERNPDIVVLEVGLGGRLDSTNVCKPLVSVITSISLDHTKQLGDSLEEIAAEKAGIIKRGVDVVSGVQGTAAAEVIRQRAADQEAPLYELGNNFHIDVDLETIKQATHNHAVDDTIRFPVFDFHDSTNSRDSISSVSLGLLGRHQAANAALAIATCRRLISTGDYSVSEDAIRSGLTQVSCPARIEVVASHPTIVVDTAHNPASMQALFNTLDEAFPHRRRIVLFASSCEKDISEMLSILVSQVDELILTRYQDNPRAISIEDLSTLAHSAVARQHVQSKGQACARITRHEQPLDALQAARAIASKYDLICITGSFFLAGELRDTVMNNESRQICSPEKPMLKVQNA